MRIAFSWNSIAIYASVTGSVSLQHSVGFSKELLPLRLQCVPCRFSYFKSKALLSFDEWISYIR